MRAKEKQRDFFAGAKLDERGYLPHFNDNLFIPLEGEDLEAFEAGEGNELQDKMRAPHSSSALCLNFFRYWKYVVPLSFTRVLGKIIFGESFHVSSSCIIRFETKHRFGRSDDRRIVRGSPGNIDVDVRSGDSHVILAESKFLEDSPPKRQDISEVNRARYEKVFNDYLDCRPAALLDGSEESKFYQLAQRLLYVAENADEGFSKIPHRVMLLLYYEHEGFDGSLLRFPEIVRSEHRHHVRMLSYQDLFKQVRKSLALPDYQPWFDYMRLRYFAQS